jgi:putative FmdB family regulatory protein
MPSYDYRCENCHITFLVKASYHYVEEENEIICPECGSNDVTRLINKGVGIVYKTKGFYNTDNDEKDNEDELIY